MFSTKEKNLNNWLIAYYRYLAVGLVIVLLILGWFILIGPQLKELKETGTLQYYSTLKELNQRKAYLEDLNRTAKTYEALNLKALHKLDLILPAEDELFLLFNQIEALIKDNNLDLLAININKEETSQEDFPQSIKKVSIAVNLQSEDSYEDLKKFLDSLERNIRILDIESLSYLPESKSYALTLQTYYLAD